MNNSPKYILIHTSDVSFAKIRNQLVSINAYHRDVRGFNRSTLGYYVGYHRLLTGGTNYQTRQDTEYGNHCNTEVDAQGNKYLPGSLKATSMNFQSLGICIGFDGDTEMPPQPELALLVEQVNMWQKMWNIPNDRVYFHRDWDMFGKTCPGSLITKAWIDAVLWPVVAPKPPDQCAKQEAIIAAQATQLSIFQKLIQALKALLANY